MNDHHESRCENCIIRQLNALKVLEKDQLSRISDRKTTKIVKKGDTIFDEGDRLHGILCVRNGVSKLSKRSENGKNTIVKLVTKGDLLGHRSVFSEERTNLSAVALNDMEMCYISKQDLNDSIDQNPKFTKEILLNMANDLKFADTIIVNMAQKTVKQRVAETLMYIENKFNVDDDGFIAMTFSRQDIANVVGTAKEACIRTLTSFKKEGWIVTDGKRIKLVNKKALYRLTEGL